VGSTVYFPTESFTRARPVSAAVVLLHELVHVNDAKKISKPLFGALYLSPQILVLLCLPLFLLSWKIALPIILLCACPIPSFFRMYFEKRAYFASLYSLHALGKKLNFDPQLDSQKDNYLKHFRDSSYYFMWPIHNIETDFNKALESIRLDQRPFNNPIFDILDDLITQV
jgi:hypothetical protein